VGLTKQDRDFLNEFIDLIIQEADELALVTAFLERWNPQKLFITLQKRLKRLEKKQVRNAVSRGLRREVIEVIDEHRCCYCGKPVVAGENYHVDHCIPYEKGGATEFRNLVTSCDVCNKRKGLKSYQDRLPDIERKRKDFIYDSVCEAWDTTEGRMAIRKLLSICGRYK